MTELIGGRVARIEQFASWSPHALRVARSAFSKNQETGVAQMKTMMKSSLLAIGVLGFATAFADVSTVQGQGSNDTAACTAAKQSGQQMIGSMNMKSIQARYEISSFSECSCEPPLSSGTRWCAVDMYYRQIQ